MTTSVQHAFTQSLMTIPNVRVLVHTDALPTVLGGRGQEFGRRALLPPIPGGMPNPFDVVRERLAKRDWRKLRALFLNLNLGDIPAVCDWLGAAGYVPQAMLEAPNNIYFTGQDVQRMSATNLGWQPGFVTQEIRQWLKGYRDVFAWLMTLGDQPFRGAIRKAKQFLVNEVETIQTTVHEILSRYKKPKLKDPVAMFMKEANAPSHLDPHILGLALRGTAISEVVRAEFLWDYDGKPGVIAHANSPIDTLCLSIHIDRNFSRRGWVQCDRCGKWLDQTRGRDRFCSKNCRNYFTTNERRKKIKLLAQAGQAWDALPSEKRTEHERWEWIVAWVNRRSRGKFELKKSWAKQELAKMKTQKQKGGKQCLS